MQTPQVTNPANVLSTPPAQSGKQADSSSTESFGQVLSREVADRQSQTEPVKAQDSSKPQNNTEATPAKPATADSKAKDDADTSDKTTEAAAQASDDLLALVANLNKVIAPAGDKTDAKGDGKSAAKDDTADTSIDPALALAASTVTTVPVTQAPVAAQAVETGTPRKPVQVDGLTGLAPNDKPAVDAAALAKADVPAKTTPVADLAAKGKELLMTDASKQAATPDFAATVKDSAAALTAAMQPMQGVQHAAVQAAQAHVDKLTPAVGTPAWDQALGQKVVWMVAGDQQSASLTLNPPDLGPLQVVLSVTNSHANATFTAAQPEVRQALEAAMPKLRDMLGEAGIQLGQATVNSGSPNQQSAPDQQASQGRRGFDNDSRSDGAIQPVRVGRVLPASSGQGLVDTFV